MQMLPEFYTSDARSSNSDSPRAFLAPLTSPDYIHSPNSNKRRRPSIDEEHNERSNRVPRVYPSPIADAATAATVASRSPSSRPSTWAGPSPSVSSRPEPRHLPAMPYEHRDVAGPPPSHHMPVKHSAAYSAPRYREEPYMAPGLYSHYNHAPRYPVQHHTAVPHHQYPAAHMPHGAVYGYDHYARYDGITNGDMKQRKRRGNLPKETTDKLRHWFMNHLSHPYPTENEKLDLMRLTGLQMSKFPIH